jgi:hypothetical protein
MHFWRSTRDIHRWNISPSQKVQASINHIAWHDFFTIRSSIYMAMSASLITTLPHIDLQYFDAPRLQWLMSSTRNRIGKRAEGQLIKDLPLSLRT